MHSLGRFDIGTGIHVTGSICSGKSALAARLAAVLDVPHINLDALHRLPGWVELR